LALVVAIIIALGLAFLIEYMNDTIQTPDDVRKHVGAPILGVVPETQGEADHVVDADSTGPFSESYRVVRTALSYSWPQGSSRVILVTSTAPSEGKTLTSVNLAAMLALTDARVLLVDCDLRKPATARLLRARRAPGLSDVLVGKVSVADAVQRPAGTRLTYIPAGRPTPSPADLLTARTWTTLLEELRKRFDWIVIDSPPMGAVSDALVLAPLVDGTIVVAGAEMVPRRAVQQTVERLKAANARILGVVLNRARFERHSYYYSRYYGNYYGEYYGDKTASGSPRANPDAVRA
jgi:capsular exopolysaccharide synthesis family protein